MKSKKTLKIKRVLTNSKEVDKNTKLIEKHPNKKIKKTKKIFTYITQKGENIIDNKTIERINKLHIPPNYNDVLINKKATAKLQAIGFDDKGRKQYIYHNDFILENKMKKYEKYIVLGKYITDIKREYNDIFNNIHNKSYNKWEQPASNNGVILYLLNECLFRIGNIKYYKSYGSHGITTLQGKHITFDEKKKITFIRFIGKKGVINESTITDTKLYNIFKTLQKNKCGEFIFDYKFNSNIYSITGEDIHKVLESYNPDLTPKMFRTWHTNCYFIHILKNNLEFLKELEKNKKMTKRVKNELMKNACREISIKLHNTPIVIKNSYLNNALFDLFINNTKNMLSMLHKCKKMNKGDTLIFIEETIRK
jgi:DNA topoisomerase I